MLHGQKNIKLFYGEFNENATNCFLAFLTRAANDRQTDMGSTYS